MIKEIEKQFKKIHEDLKYNFLFFFSMIVIMIFFGSLELAIKMSQVNPGPLSQIFAVGIKTMQNVFLALKILGIVGTIYNLYELIYKLRKFLRKLFS